MTPGAPLTIGVSLKAYLGYDQTLRWAREVAEVVRRREGHGLELFVLPCFLALVPVVRILEGAGVGVGAQDVAVSDAGNQTGEVTAGMLAAVGCRYAEVGHAERRRGSAEDESVAAAKTAAARRQGLVTVLCVGEDRMLPAEEAVTESARQLACMLGAGLPDDAHTGRVVIAYEPHWAIGAAAPAPDRHILAVVAGLRDAVAQRAPGSAVIYGGSAGPGLLTRLGAGVDGLFLGRFAHDPQAFAGVLDEAVALTARPGAAL